MKNPLKEQGRTDNHPQPEVEESIRGLEFDYSYTGKRMGGSQIELHVTSTIRDWKTLTYIRKSWYLGSKNDWKGCIKNHIIDHLNDLSVGRMMVMSLLREFEVTESNFIPWERYHNRK
ncbi:hypothetical protein [Salinimicrobium soli]|uniref:hypothetical protein n=1 Tax=Salinimicrobium soli TaxID=1254399 RepID=UPI003AABA66F